MRYSIAKFSALVAAALTTLSSCTTEPKDVDFNDFELTVLSDWMAAYVADYQYWEVSNDDDDDGDNYKSGYYTVVTNDGDTSEPIIASYADCWVKYNLTGYTLEGGICVTRNENLAYQMGVFDPLTRYSPLYQDLHFDKDDYGGSYSYDFLPECLNKAFSNPDLALRKGSKLTIYIPSEIIDGAANGSTGFLCEATLGAFQPLKAVVEVVDVIANPRTAEIADITKFTTENKGLLINYRMADSDEDIEEEDYEEYNTAQELIPERWSNALDTIANLYIDRRYTIEDSYTYIDEYKSDNPNSIYYNRNMTEVDALILEAIKKEITDDEFYEIESLDDLKKEDFIHFSGGASIRYIGRFLDGFIFDTNINSVMDLIKNEEGVSNLSSLEHSAVSSAENSQYISAWYYSIPQLRYGQWATIITSSSNGYGEITNSNNIPAHTPLLFHIFVEPMD